MNEQFNGEYIEELSDGTLCLNFLEKISICFRNEKEGSIIILSLEGEGYILLLR